MGPMVDYIIDEPCGEYKKPSTIIDLVSGKSIRS